MFRCVCILKCLQARNGVTHYKKGDPDNPGNYRPIAILSVPSKIFEVIMNRQLLDKFFK